MPKTRLDILLVERGLAESRAKAQALIMAGQVRVNGQTALKAAATLEASVTLTVDSGPRFVSRGGEKLDAALEAFKLNVSGLVCADVGSSTGGFTDCMLQRGAKKIYAIDVGKGILHWKLRNDPRVVVMEETNARFVESLPEKISLITIDASFISLKILLPVVKSWCSPLEFNREERKAREEKTNLGALSELRGSKTYVSIVALIKPQFEAGKKDVARGDGVIRDANIHEQVLRDVLTFAHAEGFTVRGLIRSPLLGPKGNTEFLTRLTYPAEKDVPEIDFENLRIETL